MDFSSFLEGFSNMTCLMSVEALPTGGYGEIRIVTGNKAYIESIENPTASPEMKSRKFVPNCLYETYVPKDLNFEDYCYRAAVLKHPMHSYVKPDRYEFWFNISFLPVAYEEGNIKYCTYTQEISTESDPSMQANISYRTASDVLATCIRLRGADDFKGAMDEVIADVRRLCGAGKCSVLLLDHGKHSCKILCEAMSDDCDFVPSVDKPYDFYDIAMTWADTIGGSNCLIIKNEQDMEFVKERNPAWAKSLADSNIRSIVLFPLKYKGDLYGYIWAINFDTTAADRIKETLDLTAFFVASEIANLRLFERLRDLSSRDMLTGVLNRNIMNNRIDRLASGLDPEFPALGIVFADLNGLKVVNDREGHFAGDLLIKNAAKALSEVFDGCEIYRAGGDEFMVLVRGLSFSEIEDMIKKLKERSKDFDHLSFAAGYCVESKSTGIRNALRKADERMYADKAEYYRNNPDKQGR